MNTGTIYGLVCPVSGRIFYIGQTIKPLQVRLSQHKCTKRKYKNPGIAEKMASLRSLGLFESVSIIAIEENVKAAMLLKREAYWISEIGKTESLCNIQIRSTVSGLLLNKTKTIALPMSVIRMAGKLNASPKTIASASDFSEHKILRAFVELECTRETLFNIKKGIKLIKGQQLKQAA